MSKTYSERVRDFSTQNVGGSLYTSMHYAEDMAEDADAELSAAREERDALRAECESLRKDAERLTWCEKNLVSLHQDGGDFYCLTYLDEDGFEKESGRHKDLRSAIAAIAERAREGQ